MGIKKCKLGWVSDREGRREGEGRKGGRREGGNGVDRGFCTQ